MEIWKPVVGYEMAYEVSDLGNVRSLTRLVKTKGGALRSAPGKLSSAHPDGMGYVHVALCNNGNSLTKNVHVIVLEAFAGRAPAGMEARHRDGNGLNNDLANLQWGTKAQNAADRVLHKTDPVGSRNPRAKLSDGQVLEIYRRAKSGEKGADIASEFSVSACTVSHIAVGRTWSHITGATERGF